MRKNTYKMVATAMFIACAISLISFPVTAAEISSVKLTDAEVSAGIEFGPGSDCPLSSPSEPQYSWISTVEPVKAKWSVYDPGMHLVTTIEHVPSVKFKITTGELAGKWAFGDGTSFTLPAFASKGTWLAKCEYIMADGSTSSPPISAEHPEYLFQGIPCTLPGDMVGNIFSYPWYLAGMKMPAIFWFPLIIFWAPAVFILVCLVFTRSITGFVDVVRGAVHAGREAARKARA